MSRPVEMEYKMQWKLSGNIQALLGFIQTSKLVIHDVIFLSCYIQVFVYKPEVGEELESVGIRFCHVSKMKENQARELRADPREYLINYGI